MNVRELQSLIAEIDRVLAGESCGGDRPESQAETASPQNLLERIRPYLLCWAERLGEPASLAEDAPDRPTQDRIAKAIATAAIEQIEAHRAAWLQPWQMDLEIVGQQRKALLRDIQQLESQRQQLVGDFLNVLLARASESLQQEMAQTLERIETQALYERGMTESAPGTPLALPKSPTQRLEELQQLQVQSDRLLASLDSTFRQVFGTLERDIQGYERSLSAAIARMHALGLQGESILETRRQDPSSDEDLQSAPVLEPPPSPPTILQDPAPLYPFAGLELSPPAWEQETPAEEVDIEALDDSEIDALLQLNDRDEDREDPWVGAEDPGAAIDEALREGYPDPWDAPDFLEPEGEMASGKSTLESRLFGDAIDPSAEENDSSSEAERWQPEMIPVEASLFDSAPETAASPAVSEIATRSAVPENETYPPVSEEEPPPTAAANFEGDEAADLEKPPYPENIATTTIASLTELLGQAYSNTETETETYSAVPLGENLIAEEEPFLTAEIGVEQVLEDPQLNQRLDEDLQRFGQANRIDLSKPPLEPSQAEAFEVHAPPPELLDENLDSSQAEAFEGDAPPPELLGENLDSIQVEALEGDAPPPELLGENLDDIDLDDLWARDEEDSAEPAEEESSSLPEEIATDPWSQPANNNSPDRGKH